MNKKTCPICGDTHTEVTQTCIKCVAELGKIQPMPSSNIAPDGYKAAWNGTELVCVETELHKVLDRIFELETNGSGGVGGDDEMSASDIASLMTSLARIEEVLTADGKVIPTPDMEARLVRLEAWYPPAQDVCVNCGIPTEICGNCGKNIQIPTVTCVNCAEESPGLTTCTHCGQSTTKHVDYFKVERDAQHALLVIAYDNAIKLKSHLTNHTRGIAALISNPLLGQVPYVYVADDAHTGCTIDASTIGMWEDALANNVRIDVCAHRSYVYPGIYITSPEDSQYIILHSEILADVAAFKNTFLAENGKYMALRESINEAKTVVEIQKVVWF